MNRTMNQSEARRLAHQLGGVATQESRYRGRWPKPGEPWVVVLGHAILREIPEGTL
jgi:hypothetical protein